MCHAMPKSKNSKNRGRNAPQKQKSTNIHHKVTVRAKTISLFLLLYVKPCHIQLLPPGFDISHANTMRRKIQNRQKLKTQRMKMLTPGETFIISTALVSINIKTTKNLLRAPPAVTFPKGKSPNHPKIRHVQVANNQKFGYHRKNVAT